jgi:hypothetical protein
MIDDEECENADKGGSGKPLAGPRALFWRIIGGI